MHEADRDMAVRDDLQCIVDLKYEVTSAAHPDAPASACLASGLTVHGAAALQAHGAAFPLSAVDELFPSIKLAGYSCEEHIGPTRDGRTPITLRFLVHLSDYAALREATFKSPFLLPRDEYRLPERLARAVRIFLNARTILSGERRITGSLKLSALVGSCLALTNAVESLSHTTGRERRNFRCTARHSSSALSRVQRAFLSATLVPPSCAQPVLPSAPRLASHRHARVQRLEFRSFAH